MKHKLSSAALLLACVFAAPSWAAESYTLENLTLDTPNGSVALPRVEFTDSNINKDEAAQLFALATPTDARAAIAQKLQAARLAIPEARFEGKQGRATAHDFIVTGLDKGRFKRLDFAGGEGTFTVPNVGDGAVKVRPLSIEDGDYSVALAAISAGDPGAGLSRLSKLTWAGLEATFPDKETPKDAAGGNLVHVDLASVAHTGTYQDNLPLKGQFVLKNLVVVPPPASKMAEQLKAFGYDKLDFGMTAKGAYDPSAKSYMLDDMTISAANGGSIGLRGTFVGLQKEAFTGVGSARSSALAAAQVASAGLKFINTGLVDKAIAFYGKTQNKSPDQVKREIAGMVMGVAPALLGGAPASQKIADAIAKFVANPGSIALAMTARGAPVRFSELWTIRDPQTFLARMDVDAIANQ